MSCDEYQTLLCLVGVDLRLTEVDVYKREREYFEIYNNGPTVDLEDFQISGSFSLNIGIPVVFPSRTYALFTPNALSFATTADPSPLVLTPDFVGHYVTTKICICYLNQRKALLQNNNLKSHHSTRVLKKCNPSFLLRF